MIFFVEYRANGSLLGHDNGLSRVFFIVPSKGPHDILASTKGSTHSLSLLRIYGVKAFMNVVHPNYFTPFP
jgi:hypothetical protein